MPDYYDRQGNPISQAEMIRLFANSEERMVALDIIGDTQVSTVHLVIDHSWEDGPPVIFETMCFGGTRDQEQIRYGTEAQARAGHQKLVAEIQAEAGVTLEEIELELAGLEGNA